MIICKYIVCTLDMTYHINIPNRSKVLDIFYENTTSYLSILIEVDDHLNNQYDESVIFEVFLTNLISISNNTTFIPFMFKYYKSFDKLEVHSISSLSNNYLNIDNLVSNNIDDKILLFTNRLSSLVEDRHFKIKNILNDNNN